MNVVRLPPMREHLARVAAPHVDLLVEGMCARRTQLAGIALVPEHGGQVYGLEGCRALAELFGRRMPKAPSRGPAVLVITRHCCGWVTLKALERASRRGAA